MIVHVSANIAKMLTELAAASGRTSEDIVEDALVGYFEEVARELEPDRVLARPY